MPPVSPLTPEDTRQFLLRMCAKANSQMAAQACQWDPALAVRAQAHLDLQTVLDLLRD